MAVRSTPFLDPARVATPEEAVRLVPAGRRILVGSGAAEPGRLVRALVDHGDHLADNEIVHLLTLGPAPYVAEGLERRFRHTAFFIGSNVRRAVQEGRADFMPVFLSEIPRLIRTRRVRIDVAMIQVSPPDQHGYVSLGVSVDIVRAAVESAEIVLAEVNPHMPRTLGDSFLHVDRIARLIPVDDPLPELPHEAPDPVHERIAAHVARLVPDGATLQVGIGKLPDAVLVALRERHDLGMHTEMCSDGVMELVKRGVLNGRRKTLLPGKLVSSFLMGSHELYRWAHDNPALEMRPSEFTNDPFVIARNERMVAINSALAVDLTGQVAADTLMGRFFSGIGGQVDFIRGAARARGGRAIIALPSTAKGGQVSRIQAALEEGAGVVTSRGDVHYVVTEHGVADLWGKSIRQRTNALIEIAHPDARGELLEAAKQRRYVFPDETVPRAVYPWEEARRERLGARGPEIVVRPVRLSDEEILRDMFDRLSDEATQRRFLGEPGPTSRDEVRHLVDLDYEQNMAIVASLGDPQDEVERFVAMARYDVDPATRMAELAFVVVDEWRNRGLGTLMMRRMGEIGRARGLAGFCADVPVAGRPVLALLEKSGLRVDARLVGEVYRVRAYFE